MIGDGNPRGRDIQIPILLTSLHIIVTYSLEFGSGYIAEGTLGCMGYFFTCGIHSRGGECAQGRETVDDQAQCAKVFALATLRMALLPPLH